MRKLSIISTLVEALRLGLRYRWLILWLALVSDIPTTVMTTMLEQFAVPPTTNPSAQETAQTAINAAMMGLFTLLFVLINIVITAMTTASLLGVLKSHPPASAIWPTVKTSIRSYTWPFVILSILLSIIACVITIPFTIVIALFGFESIAHGPPGVVGHSYFIEFIVVLMAILYLIFVKYALADPLIVIENMPPLAALKRSWQMTRGFFWYVLGSYVFLGTAEYCVGSIFQDFEPSKSVNWVKLVHFLFDSIVQCYWLLLAWCMYRQIKRQSLHRSRRHLQLTNHHRDSLPLLKAHDGCGNNGIEMQIHKLQVRCIK
jgi:hypothetical protein